MTAIKKRKTIYVLTCFKNDYWGLRDDRNRLNYHFTKVVRTKITCEKLINIYLKTENLTIKENSKCFSGSARHIDIQQIKV